MPWLSEAKKDVTSCEKLREGAHNLRSEDIRMGQPDAVKQHHLDLIEERTRRTETSKYPEERRTNVYSPSRGDRNGKSPNPNCFGN